MVPLDHSLLHRAQRVATGANVHQLGNLLFCYQQAVSLHNGGYKGHETYQRRAEDVLRQYVAAALLEREKFAMLSDVP
jgi:hypothetical protein